MPYIIDNKYIFLKIFWHNMGICICPNNQIMYIKHVGFWIYQLYINKAVKKR